MIRILRVNYKNLFGLIVFFALHNGNLHADPLITFPIVVNDIKIRVELANTPQTRARGLMERRVLAEDRGMIFVFPEEKIFSMWMKNTPIDLVVLFATKEGRIINIEHMKKNTLVSYASSGPAKYALEVSKHSPLVDSAQTNDLILGIEHIPAAEH